MCCWAGWVSDFGAARPIGARSYKELTAALAFRLCAFVQASITLFKTTSRSRPLGPEVNNLAILSLVMSTTVLSRRPLSGQLPCLRTPPRRDFLQSRRWLRLARPAKASPIQRPQFETPSRRSFFSFLRSYLSPARPTDDATPTNTAGPAAVETSVQSSTKRHNVDGLSARANESATAEPSLKNSSGNADAFMAEKDRAYLEMLKDMDGGMAGVEFENGECSGLKAQVRSDMKRVI
ncbi:uncharacterized protein EV422DRAFT_595931 [Fimicolochytrium jonesii]|uniref:uncharacterized protein n=1 Tax=Fimicolochytrium jonesii TaxID=1396493 RepID=UPI0022FF0B9B|nr:uncharacterized protein EV422DRAFT_595931 [Fimicolochytrium jonesii]KAI8820762.1 hypothetical protein EV422DRAFT_595931 [Fimicolochytrium jonesii]